MREQEFGDVASAHVRRAAQRGFEIAIAPVDGSIDQRRIFRQHLFHRGQIEMTGDDESLHPCAIDLRIVLGKIRHVIN